MPIQSDQLDMEIDFGFDDTSDSTYDIISQDSFHNSDDESRDDASDSVASSTGDTREDLYVPLNTDHLSEHDEVADIASGSLESTIVEERLSTPSLSQSGTGSTSLTLGTIVERSTDGINFQESISSLGIGNVKVSHTLQVGGPFQEQILPTITVNQTMSKKLLQLDKPLHVVYCGSRDVKHGILEKLAGAVAKSLNVTCDTESAYSKLQIIQISSFGCPNAEAQVTTIPSTGLEIHVKDCTDYLACSDSTRTSDQVIFEHCNAHSGTKKREDHNRPRRTGKSTRCRRPDLALIAHCSRDLNALSWQQSRALGGLHIPVIDIDEIDHSNKDLQFAEPATPSTIEAVHMCFQFSTAHGSITRAVPIDLSTYLSIDSRQLNRNIACLLELQNVKTQHYTSQFERMSSAVQSCFSNLATSVDSYCQRWNACFDRQDSHDVNLDEAWNLPLFKNIYWISLAVTLCSMIMVAQYFASFVQPLTMFDLAVSNQNSSQKMQAPLTMALTTVTPLTVTSGTSQELVLTGTQVPTTHTEYFVSTVTKTIQLPTMARLLPSAPVDFWLYKTEAGRLFLHSARKMPKKWQPPKDWIEVSQGSNRTIAEYSKFNESTYELHVNMSGNCDPLTIIMQPTKGHIPQKIFQIHDSEACRIKLSWKEAARSLMAWSSKMPTQIRVVPIVAASKLRNAMKDVKSNVKLQASKVNDVRLQKVNQYMSMWHQLSDRIQRSSKELSTCNKSMVIAQAQSQSAGKSFVLLKDPALTFRKLSADISHSTKHIGKRAVQAYETGSSTYLKMKHALQLSIGTTIRDEIDFFQEELYCAKRVFTDSSALWNMNFLDILKNEIHCARKMLDNQLAANHRKIESWGTLAIEFVNTTMPKVRPAEQLRTARSRVLSVAQKLQVLESSLCKKIRKPHSQTMLSAHGKPAVHIQKGTNRQDNKATWRRSLYWG